MQGTLPSSSWGRGGVYFPLKIYSATVAGELAQQHGRTLSNAVEVALSANPRPVCSPIRAAYEEVLLD